PDQQPPVRLLAGPDPDGRGRCRADRPPAPVVDERLDALHPLHRAAQFGLRLHDVFHDALPVRLLGPGSRLALPDGMVRRIAADADAHHPRHPHERHSVPPEPREPGPHGDDGRDHAARTLAASLAAGTCARLDAPSASLLAASGTDPARVRGADPTREILGPPPPMDLSRIVRRSWSPASAGSSRAGSTSQSEEVTDAEGRP